MHDMLTVDDATDNGKSAYMMSVGNSGTLAMYALGVAKGWFEKQKPWITSPSAFVHEGCGCAHVKIE